MEHWKSRSLLMIQGKNKDYLPWDQFLIPSRWHIKHLPNYIFMLIRDLKIHVHNIPYIATFTIMKINVLDANYSMLIGSPWLFDAKVTHDWDNNMITIESKGIVWMIALTRHFYWKYYFTLISSLELKVIKKMFCWSWNHICSQLEPLPHQNWNFWLP